MLQDVMFAGFGGQGIMLIGQMIAYAGMAEGRQVSWLPSYGPEMRGGTAYCTVVVSDKPIGSPVTGNPGVCVVMNRPSLEKFGPRVRPGGILIVNSSLIDITAGREDIDELRVPCNELAMELGSGKAANMVVLGALVGRTDVVKLESVDALIEKQFAAKAKFIPLNKQALRAGYERGRQGKS
ncbi:MAG: 2-oxoacid:acceptor oxidoreductase family protein [Polyangia bacterium]|jgi:2-oxoglutarate ferredoxin oxidoreductase subunit gamma|nr:2-oxoacid:acceptor oxidoreductase family protein [Polyangia bacterium]